MMHPQWESIKNIHTYISHKYPPPMAHPTTTPVLLLKTQSFPTDPYRTLLLQSQIYTPIFLPVLTHTFSKQALTQLHSLFSNPAEFLANFDAVVLTSQRAVEALNAALTHPPHGEESILSLWTSYSDSNSDSDSNSKPNSAEAGRRNKRINFFVVGPATHLSVTALIQTHFPASLATISGAETGTGEALATHILTSTSASTSAFPAPPRAKRILFPTGEKRRDTIPRVLGSHGWDVCEVSCYETVTRAEFEGELGACLRALRNGDDDGDDDGDDEYRNNDQEGTGKMWIVVFSPQGCEEMLRVCGWLAPAPAPALSSATDQSLTPRVAERYSTPAARARDGSLNPSPSSSSSAIAETGAGTSFNGGGDEDAQRNDEGKWKRRRRWKIGSSSSSRKRICVMSIGLTTQSYLRDRFGFEVDAVAPRPSAEGVLDGMI